MFEDPDIAEKEGVQQRRGSDECAKKLHDHDIAEKEEDHAQRSGGWYSDENSVGSIRFLDYDAPLHRLHLSWLFQVT